MRKRPRNFNRDLFKEKTGKAIGDWDEKQTKKYINDRVWTHFCKWMGGQTAPVLQNGKGGFFKWDVERYVNGILEGRPTYWD